MKLLFKQRLFSWFDSYDIYDEAGNTVYVVKGQFSWGHKLAIYDAYGNEVGMVVQKVLTFLPKFKFGELRKSEFLCVKEKRMKLLVIDIQKGITDSRLFNFHEFIDNTSRIIQAARDNQIEVIYFQHDDGPGTGFSIGDEEFEIAEQVHPREGEKIFTKNINSCFGNKDFTDYVKDENTLMIVGLQTNFCIDATVKSAFERGYKVIVPQGANSTFDNDYMSGEETYKYYNDMMWPKRFATCVSVDEAIKLMQS